MMARPLTPKEVFLIGKVLPWCLLYLGRIETPS